MHFFQGRTEKEKKLNFKHFLAIKFTQIFASYISAMSSYTPIFFYRKKYLEQVPRVAQLFGIISWRVWHFQKFFCVFL